MKRAGIVLRSYQSDSARKPASPPILRFQMSLRSQPPAAMKLARTILLFTLLAIESLEARTKMNSGFQCAGCGEWNETFVDSSAGVTQSYVEDCQVCCKPNLLRVTWDRSSGEYTIQAELE